MWTLRWMNIRIFPNTKDFNEVSSLAKLGGQSVPFCIIIHIEKELLSSLKNPAASSCAEDDLIRVLRKYDTNKNGFKLVEEIPLNGLFKIDDGKIFKKGEKQRKRFKCEEVRTGKVYLFSPVYEVEQVIN